MSTHSLIRLRITIYLAGLAPHVRVREAACLLADALEELEALHTQISDIINRRVEVEQELLNIAAGKVALPDATRCRELAMKLGVPSDG